MNTTLTTGSVVRHASRSAALAACLTLLFVGATACGTAHDDQAPGSGTQGGRHAVSPYMTSIELIEWEKAHHGQTVHHPAGYNKVWLAEQ